MSHDISSECRPKGLFNFTAQIPKNAYRRSLRPPPGVVEKYACPLFSELLLFYACIEGIVNVAAA
jgi:hypothetical protein